MPSVESIKVSIHEAVGWLHLTRGTHGSVIPSVDAPTGRPDDTFGAHVVFAKLIEHVISERRVFVAAFFADFAPVDNLWENLAEKVIGVLLRQEAKQ